MQPKPGFLLLKMSKLVRLYLLVCASRFESQVSISAALKRHEENKPWLYSKGFRSNLRILSALRVLASLFRMWHYHTTRF